MFFLLFVYFRKVNGHIKNIIFTNTSVLDRCSGREHLICDGTFSSIPLVESERKLFAQVFHIILLDNQDNQV